MNVQLYYEDYVVYTSTYVKCEPTGRWHIVEREDETALKKTLFIEIKTKEKTIFVSEHELMLQIDHPIQECQNESF